MRRDSWEEAPERMNRDGLDVLDQLATVELNDEGMIVVLDLLGDWATDTEGLDLLITRYAGTRAPHSS
jgi:hypothetical protein